MGELKEAFDDWLETITEEEFSKIWEDAYDKVSESLDEPTHNLTNE